MGTTVYEETVFATRLVAVLAVVTVALLALVLYQYLGTDTGLASGIGVITLGLCLLFILLTVNFRQVHIRITETGLTVGYGILSTTVNWDRVRACRTDEESSIRYGGWGLRVARIGGTWRLVFNTIDDSRVVVDVAGGRFGEIAFSTADPDRVIELIRQQADLA